VLDAKTDTLVKRFSETRRRHPFSSDALTLTEAIEFERALLADVRDLAFVFDTSDLPAAALRNWIKDFAAVDASRQTLQYESIGNKHGVPLDDDLVYDVRCQPNPPYEPKLSPLTGRDMPVVEFLEDIKAGHCEYFASAGVLLLRSAGVPARYVTGFVCRERGAGRDHWISRRKDAHAWVEMFVAGKGWLNGTQTHLEFIPERATDFIFAVFSEEFGLVGNCLLMLLYLALIARGLMIAANAPTFFARLLAGAIVLTFFTYAFVNMGMVSGILPVVGVPLPLVSYGGTALVTLFLGFGILMSIHKHRKLVQT
jgi:hypothetical protein